MGRTILLVDDEPDIRETVQIFLEDAGYRVLTASNGMEGLSVISNDDPDLVICDAMMPAMGGFEFARKLRAHPPTATVPLIMLSALGGATSVSDGIAVGVDLYLTKPFDCRELVGLVDRFLHVTRSAP